MFSASESSSARMLDAASRTMQGMGVVLANRFCFTSRDNAWNRRPPAGISNLPVSVPSSANTGRTLRLCNRPRRAMSSASSSTDTSASMRRTLDWLSTSLSKGISRDGDRVIFWTAFVISSSPRRAPEATLPISLPVTLKPTLLSLSIIGWLPRGDLTAVKSGQLSTDDVET